MRKCDDREIHVVDIRESRNGTAPATVGTEQAFGKPLDETSGKVESQR
jgi:hypothetical protein